MFSFFSKKEKELPEPSDQYIKLRNSLLMSTPEQFNIQPSGRHPEVWGILVDENFGKYTQSLRVTADGQIKIFQFNGESSIREDPIMADLLRWILYYSEECYSSLTPTTTCPLPANGNVRFSIFTFIGIYTREVEVKELATSGQKHALANLNNSYHNILFLNNWGKLQSPINVNYFKPCTVSEPTKIYSKPDLSSAPITELMPGNEFELGVVKEKKWITVTLPNGKWGYMPGETVVNTTRRLSLFESSITVYAKPSTQSAVVTVMKKNALYDVIPSGSEDENWVKIRDSAGNEGFIDGKTRGKKV